MCASVAHTKNQGNYLGCLISSSSLFLDCTPNNTQTRAYTHTHAITLVVHLKWKLHHFLPRSLFSFSFRLVFVCLPLPSRSFSPFPPDFIALQCVVGLPISFLLVIVLLNGDWAPPLHVLPCHAIVKESTPSCFPFSFLPEAGMLHPYDVSVTRLHTVVSYFLLWVLFCFVRCVTLKLSYHWHGEAF